MNTEPPYAGLKWAHFLRVMLLVPLDQGTQGNKGRKGISLLNRLIGSILRESNRKQQLKREESFFPPSLFSFFRLLCSAILYFRFFPLSLVQETKRDNRRKSRNVSFLEGCERTMVQSLAEHCTLLKGPYSTSMLCWRHLLVGLCWRHFHGP